MPLNGINLEHANTPTPVTDEKWRQMSEEQRILMLNNKLNDFLDDYPLNIVKVEVSEARSNGYITLSVTDVILAQQRGTFFLDLEAFLKSSIDEALTIWLQPAGDKSSLRKLRGIEVKS